MKRFHISLSVNDVDASVAFYSGLFGAAPTVRKPDYAKWMLDDPRVNFALSARGQAGLDHLGIQAESADELRAVQARLNTTASRVLDQGATTCCYAKSEKSWVFDPQGIAWEAFFTTGESTVYGDDVLADAQASALVPAAASTGADPLPGAKPAGACCGPAAACCAPSA